HRRKCQRRSPILGQPTTLTNSPANTSEAASSTIPGTPEGVRPGSRRHRRWLDSVCITYKLWGGFESASLQVNFGIIGQTDAEQSMTLFAQEMMPHFKN